MADTNGRRTNPQPMTIAPMTTSPAICSILFWFLTIDFHLLPRQARIRDGLPYGKRNIGVAGTCSLKQREGIGIANQNGAGERSMVGPGVVQPAVPMV